MQVYFAPTQTKQLSSPHSLLYVEMTSTIPVEPPWRSCGRCGRVSMMRVCVDCRSDTAPVEHHITPVVHSTTTKQSGTTDAMQRDFEQMAQVLHERDEQIAVLRMELLRGCGQASLPGAGTADDENVVRMLKGVTEERNHLQTELAAERQLVSYLRVQLEKAVVAQQEVVHRVGRQEQDAAALRESYRECCAKIDELCQGNEELQQQLDQAKADNGGYAEALGAATDEVDALRTMVGTVRSEIEEEVEQLRGQLAIAEEENSCLTAEKGRQEQELEQIRARWTTEVSELQELRSTEKNVAESAKDTLRQQMSDAVEAQRQSERDRKQISDELSLRRRENERLTSQLLAVEEALQATRCEAEEKLQNSRQDVRNVEERLKATAAELQQSTEQLDACTRELHDTRDELNGVIAEKTNEVRVLEEKCLACQSDLQQKAKDYDQRQLTLAAQLTALTSELSGARQLHEQARLSSERSLVELTRDNIELSQTLESNRTSQHQDCECCNAVTESLRVVLREFDGADSCTELSSAVSMLGRVTQLFVANRDANVKPRDQDATRDHQDVPRDPAVLSSDLEAHPSVVTKLQSLNDEIKRKDYAIAQLQLDVQHYRTLLDGLSDSDAHDAKRLADQLGVAAQDNALLRAEIERMKLAQCTSSRVSARGTQTAAPDGDHQSRRVSELELDEADKRAVLFVGSTIDCSAALCRSLHSALRCAVDRQEEAEAENESAADRLVAATSRMVAAEAATRRLEGVCETQRRELQDLSARMVEKEDAAATSSHLSQGQNALSFVRRTSRRLVDSTDHSDDDGLPLASYKESP